MEQFCAFYNIVFLKTNRTGDDKYSLLEPGEVVKLITEKGDWMGAGRVGAEQPAQTCRPHNAGVAVYTGTAKMRKIVFT